jgi:hypothetical protein
MANPLIASFGPEILHTMFEAVDEVLRRYPTLSAELVAKRILRAASLGVEKRTDLIKAGYGGRRRR